VLALCTGVPWRARPEAVLSLIICLTAGRSAFLKHVAACLFLGWAVQFTKGGHTTTLVQVMMSAASGSASGSASQAFRPSVKDLFSCSLSQSETI